MAITFEALAGTLSINAAQWSSGLTRAGSQLSAFRQNAQRAFQQVGQAASQVSMAMGAIGAAAAAMGVQSVRVGASFEQAMSKVGAISGATGQQLEQLTAKARELGAATSFSATQSAEAMQFFALAGFSVNETLTAIEPTLQLAAAGGLQIGQAADIASKIMKGMGLEATELGEVSDVLAKAFTTANTDLVQLGEAMKFVGPVARSAGKSLHETVAPLQIMSDAGIQASTAGTSLRGVLSRLSKDGTEVRKVFSSLGVATKEVDGSLRPLADIVDDFNFALKRQGREAEATGLLMQAFGERAGPGFATLLEAGGDALREYEQRLRDSAGTAAEIAEKQLDNLAGSFTILKSAIESLQISISQALNPGIRSIVENLTKWIQANEQLVRAGVEVFLEQMIAGVNMFTAALSRLYGFAAPAINDLSRRFWMLYEVSARWFSGLPQWQQDLLVVLGTFTLLSQVLGGLGGAIPIVGGLFMAVSSLLNPFQLLNGAMAITNSLWGMLTSMAGLVGTAITGAATATVGAAGVMVPATTTTYVAFEALKTATVAVDIAMTKMATTAELNATSLATLGMASTAATASLQKQAFAAMQADASFTRWGASATMASGMAERSTGIFARLALTLKGVLGGALAFITSPITIVAGIIAGLSAAVVYAYTVSETARDRINGAWTGIREGAQKLLSGVMAELQKWWEENGETVKIVAQRIGELVVILVSEFGKAIWELGSALMPVFLESLRAVGSAISVIVNVLGIVVGILTGDWRLAWASTIELLATIIEQMTWLIRWIPGLGDAINENIASWRGYAKQVRETRDAVNELAEAEKEADEAREGQGEKAEDQAKSMEQRIRERTKQIMEQQAKQKVDDAIEAEARARAGLPPIDQPTFSMASFDMDEMPTMAMSPDMSDDGPSRSGRGSKAERKPVAALDPQAVGRLWGQQLASATREQAVSMFERMKSDLVKALQPDEDGIVSTRDVETIFQNYFVVMSQMPGFTAEKFEEAKQKALDSMFGIEESGAELHGFFMERLQESLGEGGEMFAQSIEVQRDVMAEWMELTGNEIRQGTEVMRQQIDERIAQARKSGASLADMRELVQGRRKLIAMMRDIGNSHGEARKTAVEELQATVKAYEQSYKKIVGIAEDSAEKVSEAAKASSQSVVQEQEQQVQQVAEAAGGGRRGGGGSMIGNMMGGIMQMGQQLSAMFMQATSGLGAAQAGFVRFANSIVDPVERLNLAIGNVQARISQATFNQRAGNMTQQLQLLQQEKNNLEARRQVALQEQADDRKRLEAQAQAEFQKNQAQKREQELERARTMANEVGAVISVGQQRPVEVVLQGQARDMVKVVERYKRDQGRVMNGRGGLRVD